MPYLYPAPSLCSAEPVQWRNGTLFIDGCFQLDKWTSHIYHECLVSLPLSFVNKPRKVLILGGGDGCAAKEALKFPTVEQIVIVDYNPNVTRMARNHVELLLLNEGAMDDPKVTVIHTDATDFVREEPNGFWDTIVLDFTASDGNAPIDSTEFHCQIERILSPEGAWARVMDFPWKVAGLWSCKTPTRYFDVSYPTPVGGEAFLIALRGKTTSPLPEGVKYLTVDKLLAFRALPTLTPAEAVARAAF